jgi:membrane protein implicated in regulation of membrane protease activity
MSLLTLILYLLAAFGLSYAIGHAKVSMPVRYRIARYAFGESGKETPHGAKRIAALLLLNMIECYACSGFWIGGILAALAPSVAMLLTGLGYAGSIVLCAFATCGSNLIIALSTGAMLTAMQQHTGESMRELIDRVTPVAYALARGAGMDIGEARGDAARGQGETKQ